MHGAHTAYVRRGGPYAGGSEIILGLVAHMLGGPILDILRADEAMNSWFVVMASLLGVCALPLNRYDLQAGVLIWIAIGWFALGALLLNRGEHL